MKYAIINIFKKAWETEALPSSWDKTTIIQLFKGKGSMQDLDMYRNLHLKEMIPKVFSHMVISIAKPILLQKMSKFQIAKPGHRPQEHIYVIKSVLLLAEKYKNPILLQCMDYSKFFNKEMLVDVQAEIYSNNIGGKL